MSGTIKPSAPVFKTLIPPLVLANGSIGPTAKLDLREKQYAQVHCLIGRRVVNALTNPGKILIRGTQNDTLNLTVQSRDFFSSTAASASTTVTSGGAVGSNTCVTAATAFSFGDTLLFTANDFSGARTEVVTVLDGGTTTLVVDDPFRIARNSVVPANLVASSTPSGTATGATQSIPIPTPTPGGICVVALLNDDGAGVDPTVLSPLWTVRGTDSTLTTCSATLYTKVLGADDTDFTFATSNGIPWRAVVLMFGAGVVGTSGSVGGLAVGTTVTAPGVTASVANTVLLTVVASQETGATIAFSGGTPVQNGRIGISYETVGSGTTGGRNSTLSVGGRSFSMLQLIVPPSTTDIVTRMTDFGSTFISVPDRYEITPVNYSGFTLVFGAWSVTQESDSYT
jgi:hypothetical protein